jgi:hypothetical protein
MIFISTRPIVYETVWAMSLPHHYCLLRVISLFFTFFDIYFGTTHIGKKMTGVVLKSRFTQNSVDPCHLSLVLVCDTESNER